MASHRFRSKLEAAVWGKIEAVQSGAQFESLKLPYTLSHTYTPDIILPNGVILEVKGKFVVKGVDSRPKMLAVKAAFPQLDVRFIFQNPHTSVTPRAKMTNAEWADKHGFPWAHYLDIPKEWLL
jgi:hypothetical protein